jgi:hypothetical protein
MIVFVSDLTNCVIIAGLQSFFLVWVALFLLRMPVFEGLASPEYFAAAGPVTSSEQSH